MGLRFLAKLMSKSFTTQMSQIKTELTLTLLGPVLTLVIPAGFLDTLHKTKTADSTVAHLAANKLWLHLQVIACCFWICRKLIIPLELFWHHFCLAVCVCSCTKSEQLFHRVTPCACKSSRLCVQYESVIVCWHPAAAASFIQVSSCPGKPV